ncbi:ANL_HP_G0077030.mRNA.1.CDS.1 [Saccharomyces cerevisiae]|nr:ANL_HP_G0077030.mRNA.1.CDS.1 [Saccharomyces cerevisiae]CAI6944256.1 ANL_HP_G0077030.mRNA.1.CDS.1 [Saccharomyces cerevisiae]
MFEEDFSSKYRFKGERLPKYSSRRLVASSRFAEYYNRASFLFLEPNPNDPLNKDAAKLLCEGEKEFAEAVRLTMSGGSIEHVKYDNIVSP